MRKLTILIATAALFSSCTKESIRGSGSAVTETRNVASFTAVQAEGSSDVEIVKGTQQKVEVTGYENLVPIYETYVTNGTLVVKFRNDYYNIRNNNLKVKIELPQLSSISINGSGTTSVTGFTGSDISAIINGSGDVYSTGCIYNNAYYKVNGSGHIRAAEILVNNVEAEIIGSGKIDVMAAQKLKARISGSGDINYYGNPTTTDVGISGSGHVSRK